LVASGVLLAGEAMARVDSEMVVAVVTVLEDQEMVEGEVAEMALAMAVVREGLQAMALWGVAVGGVTVLVGEAKVTVAMG